MSAEAYNEDSPLPTHVVEAVEPEIHEMRITPASAEAVVDGRSAVLFLGGVGVFRVATVQEHGRRDGHVVTGTVETPEGDPRAAHANLFKRSLVGKLFRRPVLAYVTLGTPLDYAPTDDER